MVIDPEPGPLPLLGLGLGLGLASYSSSSSYSSMPAFPCHQRAIVALLEAWSLVEHG